MSEATDRAIYRVLDANLNRLREALRVIEEYFRFVDIRPTHAGQLNALRHSLQQMEQLLGYHNLLRSRDTVTDPLAVHTRPEELSRESAHDVLAANMKRAQEASRVIEEYAKAAAQTDASKQAKKIRFELYAFEKDLAENESDGKG